MIKENAVFREILYALKKRKENGDLNNNGVIRMVEGYFTELAFVYAELYRICKPGAMVAFVNDNVRYGGEVIPVDFLSSSFAEQFGFKVKKLYNQTEEGKQQSANGKIRACSASKKYYDMDKRKLKIRMKENGFFKTFWYTEYGKEVTT